MAKSFVRNVIKYEEVMVHKDTKNKIKLNLVPPHAYEAIAKVRMFGNEKYEALAHLINEGHSESEAVSLIKSWSREELSDYVSSKKVTLSDAWGWLETCKEEDFIEAAKRHLNALAKGEEFDSESGLPHLYHALCSLAMATELYTRSDQYHLQSTEANKNKLQEALNEIEGDK